MTHPHISLLEAGKFAILGKACASPNKLHGEYHVQWKYDGMRTLAAVDLNEGSVRFFSRNGKEKEFPEIGKAILEAFGDHDDAYDFPQFTLDGEMMSSRGFAALQAQYNRKHGRSEDGLCFNIFDVIMGGRDDWTIETRYRFLHDTPMPEGSPLDCVPNMTTINFDESTALDELCVAESDAAFAGVEGVMLKRAGSLYVHKRTSELLKRKPSSSSTLRIVSAVEGEGKFEGMLGAIECEGQDHSSGEAVDIHVWVGTGFNDDERHEIWADRQNLHGRLVEIVSDGITSRLGSGGVQSLRFPRFKGFREDV